MRGTNNADSSDEDLLEKHKKEFDTNIDDKAIQKLSLRLDVPKHQIVKSLILHNIGRMALHTPQVDRKYRKHKIKHLPDKSFLKEPPVTESQGGSQSDTPNKIILKDFVGEIVGLEELSALARFLRRSQIRSYQDFRDLVNAEPHEKRNYKRDRRLSVLTTISSRNKRQSIDIHESLVANYNGLSGNDFPNTDMVALGGESSKEDYSSAYKDNRSSYGRSNVDRVTDAASQLEKSTNLEQAINTIKTLRQEIADNHSQQDSDAFIAELIRKVCMAEPLSESLGTNIINRIYALTYLLFKTEVLRSPAALVSHVQMLELIIHGEMSLEDAFSKRQMPMASPGAIKAARYVEREYEQHLFYHYINPYRYAPQFENDFKDFPPKKLVQKEANLMDKWLKLKFGEQAESIIKNPEKHLTEIYQEINRSLQSFGLDIRIEAFHKAITHNNSQKTPEPVVEEETDFNEELQSGRISVDDLRSSFEKVSKQNLETLRARHHEKLERSLTDDERFVCLMMECRRNEMRLSANFEDGFAEISDKDGSLKAICPIQSISTDHGGFSDTIKSFISKHENLNTKMIFSLHGANHYRTLAVNPSTKTYRYIDSMQDSIDGEVDNEFLKEALRSLGYSVAKHKYKKQQYSHEISIESKGTKTHNNECAFHNIFTTFRIAQSDNLLQTKLTVLKIANEDLAQLTPETARDKLRPFYEEFFENLRNRVKQKQAQSEPLSESHTTKIIQHLEEMLPANPETPRLKITRPQSARNLVESFNTRAL